MGSSSPTWQGYQHQLLNDSTQRTYIVPNSAQPGTTPIIRSLKAKNGNLGFLKDSENNDRDTNWKMFSDTVKKYGSSDYCAWRPFIAPKKDVSLRGKYKWMTYAQFGEIAENWGLGLRSLKIPAKSNIGIYSKNRPEWYITHMGNAFQSFVTTALYDTLGANAVAFIVHHAQTPVTVLIVVEKDKLEYIWGAIEHIKHLISNNESNTDGENNINQPEEKDGKNVDGFALRYIIQIDFDEKYGNTHEFVDESDCKTAKEYGVELIAMSEIFSRGVEYRKTCTPMDIELNYPKKEDTAFLMYTSGTTGVPKGVILSHGAFSANCASLYRKFSLSPDDVVVSYLPLAHIFEAGMQACLTCEGGRVAFFCGDIKKLAADWKEIRPTILIGVPRVFSKTHSRFLAKISKLNAFKKLLIDSAIASSEKHLHSGNRSSFYDSLVWSKVAPEIGFDRVRMLASGGAPLPPRIAEFLRIILPNAYVTQGYGLTETCALATMVDKENLTLGHVGGPGDNQELRLIDAPECRYLTSDKPFARGEVQIRGMNIMDGYYRLPEKTRSVLSSDGWFSTGDIGRLNPNGTLSIIDRRKNMFKTSMGEYIAAEKLELQYEQAEIISQIWIYGNSFKSFVVGLVVPDAQVVQDILEKANLWMVDGFLCRTQTGRVAKIVSETPNDNATETADDGYGNTDFQRIRSTENDAEEEQKSNNNNGKGIIFASEEYRAVFEDICEINREFIEKAILKDMRECGCETIMQKFEIVRGIRAVFKLDELLMGFNVKNDCLTPTFKKKRPNLLRMYLKEVQDMYAANGEPANIDEEWIKS